jgi:hypothetical protein
MPDMLSHAAIARAINLSAQIAVQLDANAGASPLTALLAKAQRHAAEAMVAMATVDPEDPKAVRRLQNDLKCFDLILEWMEEIVRAGVELGDELDQASRRDIAETLGISDDEADEVHDGLPQSED